MKTHNGANMAYSTGNPLVEFFSKAGSLFEKRGSYYGNEATPVDLFQNAWSMDKIRAFKLALWLRDAREGAGNRSGGRSVIKFITSQDPEWVKLNFDLIPKYGRWDDFLAFVGTKLEADALSYWADAIRSGDGLACKWAPRENKANGAVAKSLRKILDLSAKDYRKHLASKTAVVETAMCSKNWNEIKYSQVPSVAMSRYGKAFKRNDDVRFSQYLTKVAEPDSSEKINAGTLFPHDVLRTALSGQTKVANAQFDALPNFFDTNMRVMPIIDTSGSMGTKVAGSVSAMDVSISLGMYASDRLGKENPFYRKMIPFSTKATFVDWSKDATFTDGLATFRKSTGYGWVGSTNIASAINLLLDTATFMNVTNEQMPNCLLIISDMQFNSGTSQSGTEVQNLMDIWKSRGYEVPKIVYWNTAGYAGSPDSAYNNNIGFVSGFSPSILNAVFSGEDFTPEGIMNKALEKYEIKLKA